MKAFAIAMATMDSRGLPVCKPPIVTALDAYRWPQVVATICLAGRRFHVTRLPEDRKPLEKQTTRAGELKR